jgi:hypothetical protein
LGKQNFGKGVIANGFFPIGSILKITSVKKSRRQRVIGLGMNVVIATIQRVTCFVNGLS